MGEKKAYGCEEEGGENERVSVVRVEGSLKGGRGSPPSKASKRDGRFHNMLCSLDSPARTKLVEENKRYYIIT